MWKAVVGYEGLYEVSDAGLVRSVVRTTRHGHKRKLKVLKAGRDGGGYLKVDLSRDNKHCTRLVHQLVLQAFVGPANDKHVRHLNGERQDNRLRNLCYGTPSENALDRSRHGRGIGEAHPRAVLTAKDVRFIRAWQHNRKGLHALYPHVSAATVDHARSGRNWKTIE